LGGFIPLTDASRKLSRFPVVTVAFIVVNALVFLAELGGGEPFVERWSMIPANIAAGRDWINILSGMFMHAGWLHIAGNMVFLYAFGPEIEDVMGRGRYLTFYLLSGLVASLAQIFSMPASIVPNVGASGAIAGVMGAFLITFPRDKIKTLLLFGFFVTVTAIPAALLIGLWFLVQLFNGVGSVASVQTGGVAYAAHVGGFVFGAVAARFFERFQNIPELES
jgi:membrane associated rhomboid family serine protease